MAKVPLGTQHGLLRRTRRTLVKTDPNRIGKSRDFSLAPFRRTSTSVTTDYTEGQRYGRPFSLDRHGVRSRREVARHGTAVGAGVLTPFIAPEFFVPLASSVRSWLGNISVSVGLEAHFCFRLLFWYLRSWGGVSRYHI